MVDMLLYLITVLILLLQTLSVGVGLDDDQWHTAYVKRRARKLELRVDNGSALKGNHDNRYCFLCFKKVFGASKN